MYTVQVSHNSPRRLTISNWLGSTVLYVLTCCDVSYSNRDMYPYRWYLANGRVGDAIMTFSSATFSLKVKANLALPLIVFSRDAEIT
jgi:hypothetical protein